jgi:hypothetical protein
MSIHYNRCDRFKFPLSMFTSIVIDDLIVVTITELKAPLFCSFLALSICNGYFKSCLNLKDRVPHSLSLLISSFLLLFLFSTIILLLLNLSSDLHSSTISWSTKPTLQAHPHSLLTFLSSFIS